MAVESTTDTSTTQVHSSQRSYGLHCWGLILSLFFAAIIITISAILILEVDNAVVILSVLLVLLVVVAVGIAFYIQIQRRKAARRRDQMAEEWVRRTVSQTQLKAAKDPRTLSARTSLLLWNMKHESATPTAPPLSEPSTFRFWRKNPQRANSSVPSSERGIAYEPVSTTPQLAAA